MNNKNNIEKLNRLFEETENVKMTSSDLDSHLVAAGINTDKIVESGLEEIRKILPTGISRTADIKEKDQSWENQESFPIAAAKDDSSKYDHLNKRKKD